MSTESLSDSFLNVTRLFVSVQEKTTFLFEEGSPVLQINVGVERTELAKASFTQEEVRFSKLSP